MIKTIETEKEYCGFSTFYKGTDIFIISDKKIKTKTDAARAVAAYAAKKAETVIFPEMIYDALRPAVMVKKTNKRGEYISIKGADFGTIGNADDDIIIVF